MKITAEKAKEFFKNKIHFSMADDGNRMRKNVRKSGYTQSTVKGLCQFVKIIPYITWRKVLKLFNKNHQWNKRGKSLIMEDSQETQLPFSMRAFVATFLTLQWWKGNQTARAYCHSSEPWGICHKIAT